MPGWEGSTRRQRLPREWHKIRARVKRRAGGRCQHVDANGQRCPEPGTDCDHITPGDYHDDSNLQWLCRAHHLKKSSAEGGRAPRRKKRTARPPEAHPGIIPTT